MNKEEFLALFSKKPTLCDTKEKASYFLKMCDSFSIVWSSGSSVLSYDNYQYYKEKTCYSIDNNKLYYGDMDYYIREKIDIVIFIIKEKE